MRNHTARIAIAVVTTVATSALAVVLGTAYVLGWPLSQDNLNYALERGAFWGIVGGGLLIFAAGRVPSIQTSTFLTAGVCLIWSAVIGVCFMVYSAVLAAC